MARYGGVVSSRRFRRSPSESNSSAATATFAPVSAARSLRHHDRGAGLYASCAVLQIRRLEQDRELLIENLRQAKTMNRAHARAVLASRAKSEFLANMSHELRTPSTPSSASPILSGRAPSAIATNIRNMAASFISRTSFARADQRHSTLRDRSGPQKGLSTDRCHRGRPGRGAPGARKAAAKA